MNPGNSLTTKPGWDGEEPNKPQAHSGVSKKLIVLAKEKPQTHNFCEITVKSNSLLKVKRFSHLETYDMLNFFSCFRVMRAVGEDNSNNLDILVQTFYCQRPWLFFFFLIRKKDLVN